MKVAEEICRKQSKATLQPEKVFFLLDGVVEAAPK